MTKNTDQGPVPTILDAFAAAGAFASPDVHRDTIELKPGVTAEFYVRELSDKEFRKLWEQADRAKLIASTICDEDGKPVMTEKKAAELKPLIAAELEKIALRHSGFGKSDLQEKAGNG